LQPRNDRDFQSHHCNPGIVRQGVGPPFWGIRSEMNSRIATQESGRAASGRRRPPKTPKGRQVDPKALEEVRALLGERARGRDLLIEHLHMIQDREGPLSAPPPPALAQEMKLALTKV